MMTPVTTFDEIQQECSTSDVSINLTHLQHVFEGYRAACLYGFEDLDSPYSPGSARDWSWQRGAAWARKDLGTTPERDAEYRVRFTEPTPS